MSRRAWHLILSGLILGTAAPASAAAQDGLPDPLREVRFDQRLGAEIPLDLQFRDEEGRTVTLREFFGERPVVLSLVYYRCPMLCTLVLNGLTGSLEALEFDAGEEFEVVAVSFDSRDTPELAAEKKDVYLRRYDRPGAEQGWHFLTGDQEAIDLLTETVGFSYVYEEETDQFAHAAGIIVVTPEGRVARYLYGVQYPPRDLRLAMVEAADNRIGSLVDQVLLYCFHYDPVVGRYSAVVMNLVRLAGGITLLILGASMALVWRREKRRRTAAAGA